VDKQGMRADWETRAGNNRAWGGRQVEGDGEDEWFKAGSRGQSNRQLWDEAWVSVSFTTYRSVGVGRTELIDLRNTQNASNSFQQILSPAPLPPPQIKILRRQNAQSSEPDTSSPTQGPSAPKTYKEKEEQYRLARERIFGPGPGSESSSTSPASASAPNSRGVSPIPNPNPQVHTYPALVPTQVGRVWSGHGNSNTPGGGGVSRQPRGPGDGGGFGSGGGAVGNGNGRGTVPPPLSAERGQGAFPPGW
jgi:hypothetical protein